MATDHRCGNWPGCGGLRYAAPSHPRRVIVTDTHPALSSAWASLISTVSTVGLSDILITVVVLSFFVLGFILGVFEVGRLAGVTLLGITSGLAVGIRVILLKQQLLLAGETLFFVNWLIIAFFGLLNGMVMIWKQRVGIVSNSLQAGPRPPHPFCVR